MQDELVLDEVLNSIIKDFDRDENLMVYRDERTLIKDDEENLYVDINSNGDSH